MNSLVRPAAASDSAVLADIQWESWVAAYRGLLPASYLRRLDPGRLETRWKNRLRADHRVWVAETSSAAGRAVVGYCSAGRARDTDVGAGFAGEIDMIYLYPDFVGRGLGRRMFERVRDELASEGLLWLVVWVVEANDGARAFYERMGLRADGRRRVDSFDGSEVPVVRYAQALNPVAVDLTRW